jgi:CubicO group peptidase (beta-lactamase class C family)
MSDSGESPAGPLTTDPNGRSDAGIRGRRRSGRIVWARRLGAGALVLLLAGAAVVAVAGLTTERSYWSRIIAWRDARFDDFATKFPARPIPNGPATYHFGPAPDARLPYLNAVTYQQDGRETTTPLDGFLASTGTTAFLVLKDDRLLFEGTFNGADRTSTQTSFSVAKSFASALIGIAIGEGRIGSLDDPITRYLPELSGRPGLDRIRIRHLLTMTSGLRYNGTGAGGSPFGDDARTYYDPDLRALALGVQAEVAPGGRWQYNNFHPLLLGLILERATGRTVSDYLSEKLWRPLGMEAPGSWSLDSRHDGFEKMESGLNGRAIDFAKLGRLYLLHGAWEGRQLVPAAWVDGSIRHDPEVAGPATSPAGEEWARSLDYGYMWWIDTRAPGRFFAMGNLGQYIYVAPDREAVLVRFGTRYGGVNWIAVLRELASRIP